MGSDPSPSVAGSMVRLICRYANGVMKSFVASAVSFQHDVLEVLATEQFAPNVQLTAIAPFLGGARPCFVAGIQRSQKAGYFRIELKVPAAAQTAFLPPETAGAGAGKGPRQARPDARSDASAAAEKPSPLGVLTAELAARLEAAGRSPYYQAAFAHATPRERKVFLASTAAAVLLLLERKGHLEISTVLRKLRGA